MNTKKLILKKNSKILEEGYITKDVLCAKRQTKFGAKEKENITRKGEQEEEQTPCYA